MHDGSPTTGAHRLAAAGVHAYTASGVVLALLIVMAALEGEVTTALALGLVALVIDGTDGALARWARVSTHLPWFDGRRLDDIVDYLTYVFAPVVLLLTAGYLPQGAAGLAVAAVPLVASSYQFCRVDAKTDDHMFLGFPSYWNVVALYVVVLDLSVLAVVAVLLVCAALVPVPVRYVYPSRTRTLRPLTLVLTAGWLVSCVVLLLQRPEPSALWTTLSLLYVGYYVALSLVLTARSRQAGREAAEESAGRSRGGLVAPSSASSSAHH